MQLNEYPLMTLRLTDAQIARAPAKSKPRKLTDGKGLYIEITPTGSKLWRYRYRIAGKENLYAAGEYCQAPIGESESDQEARVASGRMTLSEARIERERWRALVLRGIHPLQQRKLEKQRQSSASHNTLEAVAREWLEQRSAKKKWTPRYKNQVVDVLEADVFPYVGKIPIGTLTAADLLPIVERVEKRGAETVAILIRQWLSATFCYAIGRRLATQDHAAALKEIERPAVEHHQPMELKAVPIFLKALDSYSGHETTALGLRLLLLTFVRPGELRAAEWSEFDFDAALWRIPKERTKGRREHLVPLSRQAIDVLRELYTISGGQRFLFPNYRRRKSHMTHSTLRRALDQMGYRGVISPHSFRATASTVLNEKEYRADVIERQLGHLERDKTRRSYNHAQYLGERRKMMQAYADIILGATRVVPLRRRVAA